MGFTSLIDIIGSTIIGGFLLLILFRMNATSSQNTYEYSGEEIVQKNITEVVRLLEYDFRKIGYCADWSKIDPTRAIVRADSNRLHFLTDRITTANPFGDGTIDTLKYYLSTKSALSMTPNPNDMILYRVINNDQAAGSNLGVTEFKLTYFDANGNKIINMPANPPFGIASIQIDVAVENPAAYGNNYSVDKKAIWRQIRLASRNFKLR